MTTGVKNTESKRDVGRSPRVERGIGWLGNLQHACRALIKGVTAEKTYDVVSTTSSYSQ